MATKILDTKIDLTAYNRMIGKVTAAMVKTDDQMDLAVKKAAILIHGAAVEKIQKAKGTGRTYKRRSVTHQASSPGNPPRTDTGRLVSSIRFAFPGKRQAEVGSLANVAKYGNMLEEGTENMAARPWLEPTLRENADGISNLITAAIKHGELAS